MCTPTSSDSDSPRIRVHGHDTTFLYFVCSQMEQRSRISSHRAEINGCDLVSEPMPWCWLYYICTFTPGPYI